MDIKLKSYNAVRVDMMGDNISNVSKAILLRSSPHTHSEIQFSERHNNISFSATIAEGADCARFKDITYTHSYRWDTVIIPMRDIQEDLAFEKCKELEGTPYDKWGLLSHISPFEIIKPSPHAVWCSEVCNLVICAGRTDFYLWLGQHKFVIELTPAELETLARYYFSSLI